MVEQRKLINQKATSFALRTEEVTLENKEEFEEIVGVVNQVKEGVRKKTIQKLAKLAAESPFTVVNVGVEKPPLQMNISDNY